MRKVILALIVGLLVLSVGCVRTYTPPADNPPNSGGADTTNGDMTGDTTDVILPADTPPEGMTWISPGKVNVGNFYPGAKAEYPITVHNGNDYSCSFAVSYRFPDHTGEGYSMPPDQAQDWVMVVDTTPILAPYETRDILVVLEIPESAVVIETSWEFWISVMDTTQVGVVRTELCCRWLINMRS